MSRSMTGDADASIDPRHGINAVQRAIWAVRLMAYQGEPVEDIARCLDGIDGLIGRLAQGDFEGWNRQWTELMKLSSSFGPDPFAGPTDGDPSERA